MLPWNPPPPLPTLLAPFTQRSCIRDGVTIEHKFRFGRHYLDATNDVLVCLTSNAWLLRLWLTCLTTFQLPRRYCSVILSLVTKVWLRCPERINIILTDLSSLKRTCPVCTVLPSGHNSCLFLFFKRNLHRVNYPAQLHSHNLLHLKLCTTLVDLCTLFKLSTGLVGWWTSGHNQDLHPH